MCSTHNGGCYRFSLLTCPCADFLSTLAFHFHHVVHLIAALAGLTVGVSGGKALSETNGSKWAGEGTVAVLQRKN